MILGVQHVQRNQENSVKTAFFRRLLGILCAFRSGKMKLAGHDSSLIGADFSCEKTCLSEKFVAISWKYKISQA